MDDGKVVLAVFLDVCRAFETVDRDILIRKFQMIGVADVVRDWCVSDLSNRTEKVKYKSEISNDVETKFGILQGTVLRPLLFNIYVNDMVDSVNKYNLSMFDDDTMLYVCVRGQY